MNVNIRHKSFSIIPDIVACPACQARSGASAGARRDLRARARIDGADDDLGRRDAGKLRDRQQEVTDRARRESCSQAADRTLNNLQFSSIPFRECSPASSNSIPEPATRSFTVLEMTTSPAFPVSIMRAAR